MAEVLIIWLWVLWWWWYGWSSELDVVVAGFMADEDVLVVVLVEDTVAPILGGLPAGNGD